MTAEERSEEFSRKMQTTVAERIEAFKRRMLTEAIEQLKEDQRGFFNRIYPKGVPEDKLVSAIELCERTIVKNKKNSTNEHSGSSTENKA